MVWTALDEARTTSDTAGDHVADHNQLHAWANTANYDQEIRYVSKDGNDSNTGASWGDAKLTIKAAVESLPDRGSPASRNGVVNVGIGVFTEDNPIDFDAALWINGAQTSQSGGGTEIRGSNNAHLLARNAGFSGFAHDLRLTNLQLDGTGIVGNYDLVRIYQGGWNCYMGNLRLENAPRHGFYIEENANTMTIENCHFLNIEGDCIFFDEGGPLPLLQIKHSQADNVTGYFLNVEAEHNGTGHIVTVDGLKTENDTAGDMDHVIHFKPRVSAGGNPVSFDISNVIAGHTGGGGTAIVYEESQSGVAGIFTLKNITSANANYTNAFNSAKTSQASFGKDLIQGIFADVPSWTDQPLLELGNVAVDSGTATPESALTRPVGSLYLRSDGGAGTSAYIKESGTGNTGWETVGPY